MAEVLGIRFGTSLSEEQSGVTYSATYVVKMDSEAQNATDVADVPGVPDIGDPSPITPFARCMSRKFTDISPTVWEVECEFTTNETTYGGQEKQPWERNLPTWSWSSETIDEVLQADAITGEAFLNSANDPLPEIEMPVPIAVLTIKRAELNFQPTTILNYINRVNSATFWGAPAKSALMADISADQAEKDEVRYWNVTYKIRFRLKDADGWKVRFLNQGTRYYSGGGSSALVTARDESGNPIVVNLNDDGTLNNGTNASFTKAYNRFPEANFNALKLGPFVWG